MRKVYSLVFWLGVFLFFWLLVPYHLRFHEQFQFFRFGTDYFMESVLHPEGFSFYLGGFVTQFFLYPWAGALVVVLLLVLLQRLVARISYRVPGRADGNTFLYPLTFIPSAFVWLLLCNENYMISAVVALLLSLWAVNSYSACRCRELADSRILYPATGVVLCFRWHGYYFTACFLYGSISPGEYRSLEVVCRTCASGSGTCFPLSVAVRLFSVSLCQIA